MPFASRCRLFDPTQIIEDFLRRKHFLVDVSRVYVDILPLITNVIHRGEWRGDENTNPYSAVAGLCQRVGW
jgi:hypothetical protein